MGMSGWGKLFKVLEFLSDFLDLTISFKRFHGVFSVFTKNASVFQGCVSGA